MKTVKKIIIETVSREDVSLKSETTLKDIVFDYLEDNECGGLCTDDCGCDINDLCPCGENCFLSCVPGYKQEDPENKENYIIFSKKYGE